MDVAKDAFLDSGGVRIRYIERGAGDPVVLLHGYGDDIESAWIETGIFEDLSRDHRLLAFDLRGHGRSAKPHEPEKYGREMALDALRLMDERGIGRAHIVGHSVGGVVTAILLANEPRRMASAILIGASGRRSWDDERAYIARLEAQELEHEQSYRSMLKRTWPTDEPPPTERELAAHSKAMVRRGNDPLAHAAMIRARERERVSEANLAASRVPTLAIFGSADGNLERGRSLKAAWPALELQIVSGATHRGPRGILHRPETIALARTFLKKHPIPE